MLMVAVLRAKIEAALASRIPSALTPTPRIIRQVAATGIRHVDELLGGGLPLGAITEMAGPECSGRTSLALSFIAGMTQAAKVCAWIDVSNTLHPESAAAMGVDLRRLLWVRCGVPLTTGAQQSSQNGFSLPEKYLIPWPIKKGLHGGGFGPHPRGEVKGISDAISGLLRPEMIAPRCAEPQRRGKEEKEIFEPASTQQPTKNSRRPISFSKPWSRLDQALRVTDLLLQAGGFSSIVLDMGSIAPEYASRVPLATWFRYRTAAERTQASILLLTQYACAKSSAGLALRLQSGSALTDETTVFTGFEHCIEVARERFPPTPANLVSLRKPPQSKRYATWHSQTTWTGR
jgi:recombination protein RecA